MRCVAICSAQGYRLYGVANSFRQQGDMIKLYNRVLHITNTENTYDVFVFSYGCLVIWGLKQFEERQILMQIESFATEPLPAARYDRFIFREDRENNITSFDRLNVDIITVEAKNPQAKLAVSLGLAQSVKLKYHEKAVQRAIEQSVQLPKELSRRGKIALSNKAISKRVGDIFATRSSINLSSIYLEPEHFLEHLNINIPYQMTKSFLHIPQRVTMLNQKLNTLHELFEMLTGQLQYRLGTFFKIVATVLIIIQVLIGTIQLVR